MGLLNLNKRTLKTLHNYTGLCLSIVLAVLALTGTLLVYKDDYLRATLPEATKPFIYSASKFGQAISVIEQQLSKTDSALPSKLKQSVSYIALAHERVPLHKIVFKNGNAAYADQSGNLIKKWSQNDTLEDWIFHLHHYLFLGEFGKLTSGVVGFLAIFMVVTGVILAWPSLKSFKWRVIPRSFKRADLMTQHRELGIIFAVPIIILSFTGASMVYSTPAQILLSVFTLSGSTEFERPIASPGVINWDHALIQAQNAFPDAKLRMVSGPKTEKSPASVRMKQTQEWHQNGRTYAYINPETSQVVAIKDALKLTRAEQGNNMLYPIHSAAVGGRLVDLMTALSGIALLMLSLIASWTFIKRLKR